MFSTCIYKTELFKTNALVICNHSPTPGLGGGGGAGDSHGNERGFDQSCATAVRGKYPGFALCMQKKAVNEKIAGCLRKQQWFYQRAVPAGWGF